MILYQSAYLDYNWNRAGYPGQRHQDWTIECYKEVRVNTHIKVANCQFGNFDLPHHHWVTQAVFWAEMALGVVLVVCVGRVEVDTCLSTYRVFADSARCNFVKWHLCVWFQWSLAECLSIAAFIIYAQVTQLPASSLLRPLHEVSWSGIAFPLSRRAKPLLWPFRPDSWPGTCQTVPPGPDLLALP